MTVAEFQQTTRTSPGLISAAMRVKPNSKPVTRIRPDTKTAAIIAMFADGHTRSEIAQAIGVRYQMVYQVVDKYLSTVMDDSDALLRRVRELLGPDFDSVVK